MGVVVQWDPERIINTTSRNRTGTASYCGGKNSVFTKSLPDVRSIQIGLRGKGVQALLDPCFVLKITDVTQDFRNALSILEQCSKISSSGEGAGQQDEQIARLEE